MVPRIGMPRALSRRRTIIILLILTNNCESAEGDEGGNFKTKVRLGIRRERPRAIVNQWSRACWSSWKWRGLHHVCGRSITTTYRDRTLYNATATVASLFQTSISNISCLRETNNLNF
ncbi:hypothetical protein BDZ97DRAFT_193364 [Flammula alnicola]|nr:hypothetical protein BDZ97DRAFT_193364 [Flammula alnicola]